MPLKNTHHSLGQESYQKEYTRYNKLTKEELIKLLIHKRRQLAHCRKKVEEQSKTISDYMWAESPGQGMRGRYGY